jgi:hypothetical protein
MIAATWAMDWTTIRTASAMSITSVNVNSEPTAVITMATVSTLPTVSPQRHGDRGALNGAAAAFEVGGPGR